jgi:hypothetical protein
MGLVGEEALNRRDAASFEVFNRQQTRSHRYAVDLNDAGSACSRPAHQLGPHGCEIGADELHRGRRLGLNLHGQRVELESDTARHRVLTASFASRG